MAKDDRNALVILGVVIIALFVLYFILRNRGSSVVYNNGQPANLVIGGVEMPDMNFTPPGLLSVPDVAPPYQRLSAIGACCSDCSSSRTIGATLRAPSVPAVSVVFNDGANGPTVYNYISAAARYVTTPSVWFGS